MRVRSRKAVFPAPGLETRLTTKTPASPEPLSQLARDDVVLLENVLPDLDQAGFRIHDSISMATSSSSLPWRMSGVAVPHSEQENSCTELYGPQGIATGAEDDDRNVLDHQPRPCEWRVGQAIS